MALEKKKQNIIIIVVAVLAMALAILAVLVGTGKVKLHKEDETYYITVTEVVTDENGNPVTVAMTDEEGNEVTDENGDVVYYTMVETYTLPAKRSNHSYPSTEESTESTESTTTTTTEPHYTGVTVYYYDAVDENGEFVTDEDGKRVTVTEKVTFESDEKGNKLVDGTTAKPTTTTTTTTEPESIQTTKIIYVTDPLSKKPVKNVHGEKIVSTVVTEAPTTKKPTTTTTKPTNATKVVTTKKKETTKAEDSTTAESTTKPTTTEEVTQPSTENTATTASEVS